MAAFGPKLLKMIQYDFCMTIFVYLSKMYANIGQKEQKQKMQKTAKNG